MLLTLRPLPPRRSAAARSAVVLATVAALAAPHVARSADPAKPPAPDFNRDVRPVLADKCFHCHGPDAGTRKGNLRLDTAAGAARALKGDTAAETEFVHRITSKDAEIAMPPAESNFTKRLSAKEVATLTAWVASGAKYANHWAFEPPSVAAAPQVADPAWRGPVDRWVYARLAKEGLKPSPPADRATLLRRVTLDLTGLPPTPKEVDDFLADQSPDAYPKVVDRLLASKRYGERMAVLWMDLARYGDSSVYHADGPRDMWAWRDWVINAFNDNAPYDRFTTEQLAGDLLPNATVAQKVASGFNRNHATTDEGGVIPEEFRVDYVVDRVKTVTGTWLGLSVECAQCHDHKYDPVSQKEYYRFYAYFNNTKDPGMQTRKGNQAPVVEIPDPDAAAKKAAARQAREAAERELADLRARAVKGKPFAEWLAKQKAPAGATAPALALAFLLPLDEKDKVALLDPLGAVGTAAEGKAADAKRPGGDGARLANAVYRFGTGPGIEWDTPFTFAAWVKVPKNGGGFLLTKMGPADQEYRGFDLGTDGGKPGLHLIHEWEGNALKVYAKNPLAVDKWHHVVITADGTGKAAGVAIYVDGKPQEVTVHADTLRATIAAAAPLQLGARSDGGKFNGEADDVALYRGAAAADEVAQLAADPVLRLLAVPADRRTPEQTALLAGHFLRSSGDAGYQARAKQLAQTADAERVADRGRTSVMVMEDLPANQMRPTYVLNRGQYDQPKKNEIVTPGVPAAFPPPPDGAPANRLGLAQWLTRPDHPLTARVAVNRFWQLFFGEGLVRSTEDFGLQGEVPSHPELLDALAVDFVGSGWDVKRLVKHLVTSETYRQSSAVTPALRERDPDNRLHARGPRFRLQAEFIRDSALFVSGLYVEKVGGPSVRPYQPAGIWEEVAIDTGLSRFVQDKGEGLYRRSLYTYWKRSSPHPAMMAFDAPTREKCTGTRSRTNTPLQALVTLNDPQYVEAGRAFAERIVRAGASPADRVQFAIKAALGRPATEREVALLSKLAESQLERFKAEPKKAAALLAVGESKRDESIPPAEHAAWAVVAATVLNLDEFLVKN
ncbi:cytochrome c : Uncharacterized protein OS=Planctomyces brasiliensis (strain ATCC 49424 / DSM 5305 / JCM 21570 / NBRC 103401 / IFAM 1448) GN=Plabr_3596 PE=4 SV=1: PSCyt1: PSCyt2: Laminin_G_3: PSD1 [Gemmataceae bacterium]|nr:cytochrome c : Uncharacterized protein OS=Planctomyces brasiliensis (strain ATCC 49424 / DSM 5305 / JCM 21570 / NBRC 103401 / IFAM 1448) GN=Plabr_3596 PE=4 SV=1: PSCyt1: PSCyt2: Laminin_G_3: PSD1 [Gemmataceae bacterium]VTU01943.1 cytochrome c : Uncharacterized protein OS=Planctomyces brasiliensis (strain ATCC 49424 / DSM 5305 / JCM 21570 / NBRC 103401 / IFAM 1448) GN=Plabr_3596 PE=4 SV=1: PSCyt1: PSCyt2: Laminin_G_3: PSD1 [Gemmataceae bacterium]